VSSEPTRRRGATGPFGGDLLTQLFQHPLDPGYAEAARRRARSGASEPGVARRALSLVVVTLIGFLGAVAYRQTLAEAPAAAQAREELIEDIQRAEQRVDALAEEAERLRGEVNDLRDRVLAAEGESDEVERLRILEAATGLVRVEGPGLIVTLTDAETPRDPVTGEPLEENLGRVLDRDLQEIVNALWAAGAEAIAVNGQRLSAVSTIRTAGEAILVDFRPVSNPYEVQAIGGPQLETRFLTSGTAERFRAYHDQFGMGFQARTVDELSLPAASDPVLRHARPVISQSSSAAPPTGSATPHPSVSGGSR